MSKTRAELVSKAFDILVGGDAGQSVSDDDASAIDGFIDPVVARLASKSAVYIPDTDEIEDDVFLSLAALVANAAADEFGGAQDPAKEKFHTNELRVITRQTPGYGPQQVEYF